MGTNMKKAFTTLVCLLFLEINDIKVKGDTYASSFYVDGTPVDLTMTQKGNKLEGTADAGGMRIPVKFKKTRK